MKLKRHYKEFKDSYNQKRSLAGIWSRFFKFFCVAALIGSSVMKTAVPEMVYGEETDNPYLKVDLSGVTNPAERASRLNPPVSILEHAKGMVEAQEIAAKNGIKNSYMTCPDGFERYFNDKGLVVKDQLVPDRSAYVDIDGIKLDPKDNNINKTFMKCISHGRRALAYDKSSHYLELWENGAMKKSYMVTSGAAEGDKERQGDYKTPLGYFYIWEKKVSDSLKEELCLNYPNIEDAKRGYKAGLISRDTKNSIFEACRTLSRPISGTPLGGAIEVHGNGELMDATRGCIGVYNEWMKEIYDIMQVGDRVYIVE